MANTSSLARAKGGKGKRPYRRKLENGPKRPLSAYNLFFRAERERILAECEGITINMQTTKKGKRAHRKTHGAVNFSDMGKRIAAAWKALDETGRAPFVAEAAQDMKRYQEAKEEAQQQAAVQKPPCKNNIENEEGAPKSKIQNSESTLFQNITTQLQTNIAEETTKKMPYEGITDPNQIAQAFSPPDPQTIMGILLHLKMLLLHKIMHSSAKSATQLSFRVTMNVCNTSRSVQRIKGESDQMKQER